MNSITLQAKLQGWVNSVINPPSVAEEDMIPVVISEEDIAVPNRDTPFIVIGYTPAALTPIGNGGSRLDVQEKSTNGVFESGDTVDTDTGISNIRNFHSVSDGSLTIAVDGDSPATQVTGLDFTDALSMSEVARILQTEINIALGENRVEVGFVYGVSVESPSYFKFSSVLTGSDSAVIVTTGLTGTDIFGALYLNGGTSTPGEDDTGTEQIFLTDYEADIEIRQCYGEGELLQQLVNSKWLPSTISYFDKNKFSLNEMGPIQGIPFKDGKRTIKESIITCKFSFYGVAKEDVFTIETVGISGVAENQDSSKSHEISIGG